MLLLLTTQKLNRSQPEASSKNSRSEYPSLYPRKKKQDSTAQNKTGNLRIDVFR